METFETERAARSERGERSAPSELLRREDGALRSMAAALGSGGQEMLLQRG